MLDVLLHPLPFSGSMQSRKHALRPPVPRFGCNRSSKACQCPEEILIVVHRRCGAVNPTESGIDMPESPRLTPMGNRRPYLCGNRQSAALQSVFETRYAAVRYDFPLSTAATPYYDLRTIETN